MDFKSDKSIYLQLAEWLEDAILSGSFAEESQVPSTTEISVSCRINPATALKGMNILVEHDIIYKKRGLGMFVSEGAREKIFKRRKKSFYDDYIRPLMSEAGKLGIDKSEILKMVERSCNNETSGN